MVSGAMELSLSDYMEMVDISTGVLDVKEGKVKTCVLSQYSSFILLFLCQGLVGDHFQPDQGAPE